MVVPDLLLFSFFLLFAFSLLVKSTLELRHAVNVTVSANIVPLTCQDEVTLHVDKHDENEHVPDDSRKDANILGVTGWAAELIQSNNVVNSGDQVLVCLNFFVAVENTEGRRRAEHWQLNH